MQKQILQFAVSANDGFDAVLKNQTEKDGVSVYTFELLWKGDEVDDKTEFSINWSASMVDTMYFWSPCARFERKIGAEWCGYNNAMISRNAPVYCYHNGQSTNHTTIAISECAKLTYFKGGVSEYTGELNFSLRIPVKQYTNLSSATISIRIDEREIPMHKALDDVRLWWENDCGMTPAFVPADAKEPVYSFWYSYHRSINEKEVEEECARAKKLGFNVCIVDDGWQCSDKQFGYRYCGDWRPVDDKFPHMKEHVEAVHKLGMKYILWYSVPFIGIESNNYEKYKDKLLKNIYGGNVGLFDPRYKEVRDFLVELYKKAIVEWDLDGLKLDFVDCWVDEAGNAPYDPKMDIPALTDAVDTFMITVMKELKAIKPDILLEFRQSYIGPNMRKYGNMFRVGDCPYDYISNRVGVFDLRMLMGESAVHSDMLMWNENEKPENAALQIISVLFAVLQYSAKLENMTEDTFKMSKFWLDFMNEHKELLLESPLCAYDPHLLYSWAMSERDDECMVAVYSIDKCVKPADKDTIYIANGCMGERVLLELCGTYDATVKNCYGDVVAQSTVSANGITSINVPVGGLVVLKRS